MNSARKIQCALGLVFLLLCLARVGAAQTTCNATWVSTTVYTAGMKVSLNGINYTRKFLDARAKSGHEQQWIR